MLSDEARFARKFKWMLSLYRVEGYMIGYLFQTYTRDPMNATELVYYILPLLSSACMALLHLYGSNNMTITLLQMVACLCSTS